MKVVAAILGLAALGTSCALLMGMFVFWSLPTEAGWTAVRFVFAWLVAVLAVWAIWGPVVGYMLGRKK